MTAAADERGGTALYTPDILALAVALADYPLTDAMIHRGDAVSRVCGSQIALGLVVDGHGRIADAGARVNACAIGQAAAAIFLRGAAGHDRTTLDRLVPKLETWLAEGAEQPDWPGLDRLAAARRYPARHAAIVLPWKAALAALSNRATPD